MKNPLNICLFIGVLFFFFSCTTQKPLYYWGGYQDTFYKNMKKADENAYINHIATLEWIMSNADELGMKVPPGIYAEYGYLKLMEGETDIAKKYYELEMETYPESANLMQLLMNNL